MKKLLCRTCNNTRTSEDFTFKSQRYNKKGELVTYYNLNKYKICNKEEKQYKRNVDYNKGFLYKEAYDFMKYISRVRGYIDIIDVYKLIDHHINTFGYNEKILDDSLEELYMDLYKVYKKYKKAG